MHIDTVVYFSITDPKLYTYGIENPISAIENLTATTLRNIIGDLELDETLTSRDVINTSMRSILDEATDPWGVKVHRVEVKNILPPKDIQESMEKQMRAERERREAILKAEGEKKAAILIAEGEKESTILRADAEKEAKIKAAEAEVKNAETALSSINKLIDELVITSPLSGVLGSKSYELGEFVKENESIATIMDISNVYGVINIQEKDIVNYSVGSNIEIEIPSLSRKINTKISEISPYADPQSGNFSVKAKIENKDNIIKPGMFIKCNLKQANTTTLYKLPESTLISKSNDVGLVFYVNNGFVIQQSINIKHLKDGFVWFDSELNENDYIINNPSPFLREGQSVSTK